MKIPSVESTYKVLMDKSNRILEKIAMEQESKTVFPPLSQEPILHVDSTPDANYPLRILRAYRLNADCCYEVTGVDEKSRVIWDMMNSFQEKRAKLLDKALEILERHSAELLEVAKDET